MKMRDIIPAWGGILKGYRPFLSVEITKDCPLRCPGCYTYSPRHLDNGPIRDLSDLRGQALVDGVLGLVRRFRPLHLSIVGGEPLLRYKELEELLPRLDATGLEVQIATSAVRRIPPHWAKLSNLHLVVSVDGLQQEHEARRSPATYSRILENIEGHQIIVHCTITNQLLERDGYLHEFADYWSRRQEVHRIWFSLFTPQEGADIVERLTPEKREYAIGILAGLQPVMPKVYLPDVVLDGYRNPPMSAEECIFAQVTTCISADLTTRIQPCQLGGKPLCTECGCIASAGLAAIGKFRLGGFLPVSSVLRASMKLSTLFNNGR